MRVGVALPTGIPGTDPDMTIRWAVRAEELGFSHLAAIDRIKYGNYDPLMVLAVAAAVTRRVHLATTILIAPLHNTVILAKQLASLDRLSQGRLVLGVGVGARADDYEIAGLSAAQRGRRLSEQLTDLRRHWEDPAIGPPPARARGPRILVGGSSGPALARMACYADGYIHGGGPPRAFSRAADQARAAWAHAERPGQPELWGQSYFALGTAADDGARYLKDYYAFTGPFAERIAAGLLTTPHAVVENIRGYREAGCDELSLLPAVADLDQLERLATLIPGAASP
jgi:alkanesulfonate monooxygenase SsuD/methylene tetrahydromethanopterin reductase-like flavin-dependent oxidoreductase (luciferase family)